MLGQVALVLWMAPLNADAMWDLSLRLYDGELAEARRGLFAMQPLHSAAHLDQALRLREWTDVVVCDRLLMEGAGGVLRSLGANGPRTVFDTFCPLIAQGQGASPRIVCLSVSQSLSLSLSPCLSVC